ncbi:prepilin-type N-terminal cleavage/methylation domain-containing protein [bacterium]|nr:prepilin-type N-terminal cleavage/methylation domain-containing protein [bacterium]
MSKSPSGFTLIELLIVVAIIAILAAIAVPNFLEAQTRSKVSRAKADLRTTQTALEAYLVDNNTYPYSESLSASIWMLPGGRPRFNPSNHEVGGLTSPIAYITSIPDDVFKHTQVDSSGVSTSVIAPIYYERAGFGYMNGVKLTDRASAVPSDALNGSIIGASLTNVAITDPRLTPRAYILYSLGPDLSPHVETFGGGTPVTTSRWSILNRYDPTNGTISPGNIIRYPGGTSFP